MWLANALVKSINIHEGICYICVGNKTTPPHEVCFDIYHQDQKRENSDSVAELEDELAVASASPSPNSSEPDLTTSDSSIFFQ